MSIGLMNLPHTQPGGPEEVDVVFEHQLEDVFLVDEINLWVGLVHCVTQQGQARQGEVVL